MEASEDDPDCSMRGVGDLPDLLREFLCRMLVGREMAEIRQAEPAEVPSMRLHQERHSEDPLPDLTPPVVDDNRRGDTTGAFYTDDGGESADTSDYVVTGSIIQTAFVVSADAADESPSATSSRASSDEAPVALRITSSADHRKAIEAAISRQFPDLDADTRAGWLDAYSEMSVGDVETLLAEKKQMPEIAPLGSYLSSDFLSPAAKVRQSPLSDRLLQHIAEVTRRNLLNVDTVGYRRQNSHTQLAGVSSGTAADRIEASSVSYGLSQGRFVSTGSPLHFRIATYGAVLFRLEPGCVLTRCGRFERLSDGRIGVKSGDQSLALYGDLRVPEDAINIKLDENGQLTCELPVEAEAQPSLHEIGQIQVAVVTDATQLRSQNGVYFSVANSAVEQYVTMSDSATVLQHSLELSNVDVDTEYKTLDRIERLQP